MTINSKDFDAFKEFLNGLYFGSCPPEANGELSFEDTIVVFNGSSNYTIWVMSVGTNRVFHIVNDTENDLAYTLYYNSDENKVESFYDTKTCVPVDEATFKQIYFDIFPGREIDDVLVY